MNRSSDYQHPPQQAPFETDKRIKIILLLTEFSKENKIIGITNSYLLYKYERMIDSGIDCLFLIDLYRIMKQGPWK